MFSRLSAFWRLPRALFDDLEDPMGGPDAHTLWKLDVVLQESRPLPQLIAGITK
jgi:hypothetical protein